MLIKFDNSCKKNIFCVSQDFLIPPREDDSVITAVAVGSDGDNTGVSGRGLTS